MSEQIDPNGFGTDVERALDRVDNLPEKADEDWKREKLGDDQTKIREYVYGVEDSLASGTLRTRIGRLRRVAEQTETPLSEIDSKTTITTALGKMSRERGWKTSETKRNYIKALKGFYRFHEKPDLAEELNEFVRENLNVPSTEDVDEDKVLWKEEFDTLLEHTKTSRERAIVSTLWEGAYRATALCALTVGSYERQGDTHAIITTPDHVGSKDADAQQKPMTFSRGYIDRWLQNDHPCPDDDDAALFCKVRNNAEQAGEHVTTQYLRRILKDIARRTDDDELVEKTTPHAFRHGRVTYLAQNDYTERLIEHNLDWSRDTAQHRRYEHLQQEDKVNALLRNAGIEPNEEPEEEETINCPRCDTIVLESANFCPVCSLKITDEVPEWFQFYQRLPGSDDDPIAKRFANEATAAPALYGLKKDSYDHAVRRLVSGVAKALLDSDFRDRHDIQRQEAVAMLDRLQEQQVDLRNYAEHKTEYHVGDSRLEPEELESALGELDEDVSLAD